MKKNYYKISTYILGLLLVITLFFLFDATKNPPSIIGAFSNNTALSDNVNIGFAVKRANGYRLYFQGKEFDHGIYKKSSDNAYVLEPKNGANGAIIITNKKSYLYYPKLKEKIIVVQQTTAIKQAAKKVIIWEQIPDESYARISRKSLTERLTKAITNHICYGFFLLFKYIY